MNKYIKYFSGLLTMCLGIAILVTVNLGPSSWDALSGGISDLLSVSFGIATFIVGVFLVLVCSLIRREIPNYKPIIMSFVTGMFINFWLWFPIVNNINSKNYNTITLWCIAFLGLIFMAIGINLYVKANIAPNAIDYMMLTIYEVFEIPFGWAKILTDMFGLILAFIFSGPIGPFTFVIVGTLGLFVGIFEKAYYLIFNE